MDGFSVLLVFWVFLFIIADVMLACFLLVWWSFQASLRQSGTVGPWFASRNCRLSLGSNANRSWNILNWNIRGLNDEGKCRALRSKIEESCCSIFCVQETKMQLISLLHVKKFVPKRFANLHFVPLMGHQRGLK